MTGEKISFSSTRLIFYIRFIVNFLFSISLLSLIFFQPHLIDKILDVLPFLNKALNLKTILITALLLLTIIFLISMYRRLFLLPFIAAIQGKGKINNVPGIILVIYIWTSLSLIPNYIANKEIIKASLLLLFVVVLSLLSGLLYKIFSKISTSKRNGREVLVFGLSLFQDRKKDSNRKFNEISEWRDLEQTTWWPAFLSIQKHKSLKLIYVIVSRGFTEEQVEHFKNLIRGYYEKNNYKNSSLPEIIVEKCEDVNDIHKATNLCRKIFKAINEKYSDDKIVSNITGSTAVISSALTMFSIKGKRLFEYVRQDTSELIESQLNIFTINELIQEIYEVVTEGSMG